MSKKMKKTNNPSTEEQITTTYVFDEYISTIDFRKRPVSDNWILQLARRLRDWAVNDPEALTLVSFYNKEGIASRDLARWCERVPALQLAYETAMATIGARREIAGLKRDFDSGIVRTTMPIYDKKFKDLEEWRSSLRADQSVKEEFEAAVARYVAAREVILKDLPVSEHVPDKPTPEEVASKINRKMLSNFDKDK